MEFCTAVLSNWVIYEIMREAGVPEGVVNFVPGKNRQKLSNYSQNQPIYF